MSRRDPRVNPLPGDVIRRPDDPRAFYVLAVEADGSITGKFTPKGLRGSLCGLKYWREVFAKNAAIVRMAA